MDINHVNENSFVCVMLWCPSFYWPGIHRNHLFGIIYLKSLIWSHSSGIIHMEPFIWIHLIVSLYR